MLNGLEGSHWSFDEKGHVSSLNWNFAWNWDLWLNETKQVELNAKSVDRASASKSNSSCYLFVCLK